MRQLLFVGLTLLYGITFGQTISFDKANGSEYDLATAVTALELIAQNKILKRDKEVIEMEKPVDANNPPPAPPPPPGLPDNKENR